MTSRLVVAATALAAVCAGQDAAPAPAAPIRHVFERVRFGNIPVELCLYAASEADAAAAPDAAFARLDELAAMMSDYALDPPSALNVDAAGLNAPCTPDGVCDGNDAFAALNAFSGTTTCACPGAPAPGPSGPKEPIP